MHAKVAETLYLEGMAGSLAWWCNDTVCKLKTKKQKKKRPQSTVNNFPPTDYRLAISPYYNCIQKLATLFF